jgi:hypothetical protein
LTLSISLALVFIAFCVLMGAVLGYCIRERRAVEGSGRDARSHAHRTPQEMERQDQRIVLVLFGAIIGGAALALITGYLVFFRSWT